MISPAEDSPQTAPGARPATLPLIATQPGREAISVTTPAPATTSRSLAAPVFGVILLLLFGFAFSEEVITVVLEAVGRDDSAAPAVEIVVDAVTLLVVGLLKRRIDRIDGGVRDYGAGGGAASSSSWRATWCSSCSADHPRCGWTS